ncbi:LOW QUALITY PROTEIN: ATP-dependent protease La Type I [Limimaricola cinnabarinus LL-001]|uniref:ATP-dependent protease La Type I n=1 Tax=Limimaricola cinnabarinus LL-001 TaxID=1337093 RepID=U3AI23_9RHOB|nr:LOW QUALITY PROTEIN: ATP-dependent protease La Type I [Limimaricola cinnabarinus LL-001]
MQEPLSPSYPVLPLRDIVVFPHMIVPLFVGREKSVRALEEVMADDKQILLSSQVDPGVDDPSAEGIYKAGVLANVLQLLKLPDGTVKVLVEGKSRVRIAEFIENDSFFEARAEYLSETPGDLEIVTALVQSVAQEFERYSKIRKNIPEEALSAVTEATDPAKLADLVAGHLGIDVKQKQDLLETLDVAQRLEKVYGLMQGEMSVLQVEKKIKTRVKSQMERTQREYYLNEQMKAIQKELGDGEDGQNEVAELEKRVAEVKLSDEAREKAEAEIKKLKNMSPMSAEATVVRNYLDWLLSIPWNTPSKTKKDLGLAQKCSTTIISALRRSRSGSSSIWRCSSARRSLRGRSCASSALRASARRAWANRSPRPRGANSSASRSAACVTRARSAATAGLISAPCPARSSKR